jgi:predicted O-methyltransferase YrrM
MGDDRELPPPQRMMEMITGYWVTQIVSAVATFRVVDHIQDGARTPDDVARACGTDHHATMRLLRAGASLGLFEHASDGYRVTPLGATLGSGDGTMRGMAIAQGAPGHWLPWGRFHDAIRTGKRQTPAALGAEIFDYYGTHAEEAEAFTGAMDALSAMVAGEIAAHVDTRGVARVIDVGGSRGTLAVALLRANPSLAAVALELPHVVPAARAAVKAAGCEARCEVAGGDFFVAVPEGDLFLLKQILHDWDDRQCLQILASCTKAMRPGGRVVIVEQIVPGESSPSPVTLMDLNMLVMLPGRERTLREYDALLQAAGLRLGRVLQTRSPFSLLEATRA